MQKHIESVSQSAIILKKTVQFIGHHRLAATPVNYTVCYEYFYGDHSLMREAIDQAISSRTPITGDLMQHWFDTFLLGFDLKELGQSQSELNRIANQLSSITTQAEGNVSQFDSSLRDCKNELGETANSASLSSVVSLLLSSTSSMQVAMDQMKQQINASQMEIASLHDRLEMATVEALTDPLTGLTNRKGLSMAIDEALFIAEQAYPCLLMLDIDHFKYINDNFGHLLGDKAIKMVADTLKKQIKGKDTAARYGGEEFAVLLPETELQNAWKIAENIRGIIENMKITRANDKQEICRMTISIGIARYQPGGGITDFIEQADNALYQSKNTGRNRVTVFEA